MVVRRESRAMKMAAATESIEKTEAPSVELSKIKSPDADHNNVLQIDREIERRTVRKLDLFITPVLFLVYLSCYIDRANIGNVKVAGMPKDIGASNQQFSTAVSIFFATYIPTETPGVLLARRFQPRLMICIFCVIWAATTIANGFITSVGGLYACRLVLGACEGGLIPALNMYLTLVYKREEMAKRTAYLLSCIALSGAFGGLLAYGFLQIKAAGLPGWRWVYIIEGILSFLMIPIIWFGLPTDITKAYFLNEEERRVVALRNEERKAYMGDDKLDWAEVKLAFTDPKVWLSAWTQFTSDILTNGFSTFLPSILNSMGYDTLASNYMTIPVYVLGTIGLVTTAFLSDKYNKAGVFLLGTNMFGIIGYAILLGASSTAVKYFGCFVAAVGIYTLIGLNLAWLNVNIAPQYRRATAIGIQLTVGNSAGAVAGQIYRQSPYYLGNGFSLGSIVVAQALIAIHIWYLKRLNREKQAILAGDKEDRRKRTTGDHDLHFVYRT